MFVSYVRSRTYDNNSLAFYHRARTCRTVHANLHVGTQKGSAEQKGEKKGPLVMS